MTKKVIFVCMGNSCRSPMAEAFFRQRVEEECISYDTSSRGLRATDGGRAAPEGIQVCKIKFDCFSFRFRIIIEFVTKRLWGKIMGSIFLIIAELP